MVFLIFNFSFLLETFFSFQARPNIARREVPEAAAAATADTDDSVQILDE
jgi:hypothetical protein